MILTNYLKLLATTEVIIQVIPKLLIKILDDTDKIFRNTGNYLNILTIT
jgi:hypothetical protein